MPRDGTLCGYPLRLASGSHHAAARRRHPLSHSRAEQSHGRRRRRLRPEEDTLKSIFTVASSLSLSAPLLIGSVLDRFGPRKAVSLCLALVTGLFCVARAPPDSVILYMSPSHSLAQVGRRCKMRCSRPRVIPRKGEVCDNDPRRLLPALNRLLAEF